MDKETTPSSVAPQELTKEQQAFQNLGNEVPFAGDETEKFKDQKYKTNEIILEAIPELFKHSAVFGTGNYYFKHSEFNNSVLQGNNESILESIKNLSNGRYKDNYGIDYSGKGFTGLGQVSGALDYFDQGYGKLIDNNKTKAFIKTCIAMWPMGNVRSYGVHDFAKSAEMDENSASLVNMIIDRNDMKLVERFFDEKDENAGAKLLDVNIRYLTKLNDGYEDESVRLAARCACNLQKIVMDCEKEGARIAKERKANTNR